MQSSSGSTACGLASTTSQGIKWRLSRSLEAAEFIQRCFTEKAPFDHEGRYYTFKNVDFTTRPVQDPIPIWWAGIAPKSIDAAARNGWSLIAYSPTYDEALVRYGRDPEQYGHGATPLFACVAPTRDEAWDVCEEGIRRSILFYRERQEPGPVHIGVTLEGPLPDPLPPARELRNYEGLGVYSPHEPSLIGTPESVTEALQNFKRGARVTDIALVFRHPGMTNEQVRSSMDLFAAEVVPKIR
jgi:alkanesulfonate monooxygenase SsuD/methylene tetrahydromethanopterin reductase-like flavin-dependent oxidoreductase (luciferase family)